MKTYKQLYYETLHKYNNLLVKNNNLFSDNVMYKNTITQTSLVDPIEHNVLKDSCHMALEALEAIRCIELQARLALPDDKKENKTFSECIAEEALLRIKGE